MQPGRLLVTAAYHRGRTIEDPTQQLFVSLFQNQVRRIKALKEANLKIAALEMLIENAGKELGVDLVKKLGTKQLGK